MEIKVLGPGCPKCQATEKNVKEAVAEAAVDANIEKITDTMKIAQYGVFGVPAVVVDGGWTHGRLHRPLRRRQPGGDPHPRQAGDHELDQQVN